jgi:PRC-barrel domain
MEPGTGMRGQKLMRIKVTAAALALITLLPCTIEVAFSEDAQPAANNQPTGPAANTPQPAPPAAVTVLNDHEVEGILGREVVSSASEDMGRIVDVLVDRRGQVRAAIIDFGGFLGVGSRKIAVDWSALQFPPPGKPDAKITLELTRDQVKAAPEYQEGKPIVVLSALGKLEPLPE